MEYRPLKHEDKPVVKYASRGNGNSAMHAVDRETRATDSEHAERFADVLRISEVSQLLRIPKAEVRELMWAGVFGQVLRNAGGNYRLNRGAVLEYLALMPCKPALDNSGSGGRLRCDAFWLCD